MQTIDPSAGGGAGGGGATGGRGLLPYPLKRLGNARQVVIVTSRSWTSTQARLQAFQERAGGWTPLGEPVPARVGRTGMIKAERRKQGSGTTPAGLFPLRGAFGLAPDPGCLLPYTHVVGPDLWWVTDPVSPYYNTLRAAEKGGFSLSETGSRASIRIASHPMRYEYALVIDFNRPQPVRNRGAGIFVQVSTGTATTGSVSIDREPLLELVRWLDPSQHPVVAIATELEMAQY